MFMKKFIPPSITSLTCELLRSVALSSALTLALFLHPSAANDTGLLEIDVSKFSKPTVIDNEWLPLKPGRKLVFEGHTTENKKKKPRRLVSIVTDLTKVVNGLRVVVVLDHDYSDGNLVEAELAFFAQDDEGNVWHIGEHTEVYDEVELVGARTWFFRYPQGAKAGIQMKAKPKPNKVSYSQGFAPPPFNWTDRARVTKMGAKYKTPYRNFDDVLITEEFSQEEPDAAQLKYYVRGIGNVGAGWTGNDPNKETLKLVEVKTLSPTELEAAAREALKLEERAYIYGTTLPARRQSNTVDAERKSNTVDAERKITDDQAKEIALKTVPGKFIGIEIERKMGGKRIVATVIAEKTKIETDVIIDMATGKVLGIEE